MKAPLHFRILDELVSVELEPPKSRMRQDEMLPALRAIDDELAVLAVRRHGQPVTCAKGCSACCRVQAVPVTPAEAYALLLLVEGLPEPRRSEIEARFADRAARLQEAGLAEGFLEGRRTSRDEEAQERAQQYLDLGLVCPFLENDACSIHPERPLSCREYFVTSPKELCADPARLQARAVPVVLWTIEVGVAIDQQLSGKRSYTIPLTLALVYSRSHREELERTYDGNQVFAHSIACLIELATRSSLKLVPHSL
jgi:Fe-S-cluster containining protein